MGNFDGRMSRGCAQCRQRRIKCDQTRPSCQQCVKSKRNCGGYREEMDLIFRDQTQQTKSRVTSPVTRKPVPHAYIELLMAPPYFQSPSTNWNDAAAQYFYTNYVVPDSEQSNPGPYAYVPALIHSCSRTSILPCAVAAVSMAMLSSRLNHHSLAVQAGRCYSQAMRLLKNTLMDPIEACSNHCLMSIMLLALYELVSPHSETQLEWGYHVEGAMTLVRLRCQQNLLQDPISQRLSVAVTDQHSFWASWFPSKSSSQSQLLLDSDFASMSSGLNKYLIETPRLRRKVARALDAPEPELRQLKISEAVSFAEGIQAGLLRTMPATAGQDDAPLSISQADATSMASIMSRVGQIMVTDAIERLIRAFGADCMELETSILRHRPMSDIHSMAVDLTSFAEDTFNLEKQTTRAAGLPSVPDAKPLPLMFPLYALATSRVVPERERNRAAGLLRQIASVTGMGIFRRLSKEADFEPYSVYQIGSPFRDHFDWGND